MSQQPPEWWSRQRGPRLGCADVTIVSIASITAFVLLIFVLFRPDFAKVVDVTNHNGGPTVSAIRPTETPAPILTSGADVTNPGGSSTISNTPVPPANTVVANVPPTAVPTATPFPSPTPTFRSGVTRDECRLRQDTSYDAPIIKVYKTGSPFKIYSEQRYDDKDKVTFYRVAADDGTTIEGWMVSTCF